jgi:hypothetical protein
MKETEEIKVEIAEKAYTKESDRKEILEKKISFLFGFLSIVIGSFVLKNDWIDNLLKSIQENEKGGVLLKVEILLLLLSLIVAFVFVFRALSLKQYRLNYPKNLSETLYAPNGSFSKINENKELLNEYGAFLSIASEDNSKLNTEKAKWLKMAWYSSIFISIILVSIIITFVTLKF